MTRWEYCGVDVNHVELNDSAIIETLNELGAQGWEFTGYAHSSEGSEWTHYLMKRELQTRGNNDPKPSVASMLKEQR